MPRLFASLCSKTSALSKYLIMEDSLIARLAAWKLGVRSVAIVIGRTVYLYNATRDEFLTNTRWVRHELVHIQQFKRYGWIRFVILYLGESLRRGYYNNRFEVEARQGEHDNSLDRYFAGFSRPG